MVMSLAMRANCFAMRFQRANIVCFADFEDASHGGMVHQARGGVPSRQRRLRELRLQYPHAPHLQTQAPLDFPELALQVDVLPLLDALRVSSLRATLP